MALSTRMFVLVPRATTGCSLRTGFMSSTSVTVSRCSPRSPFVSRLESFLLLPDVLARWPASAVRTVRAQPATLSELLCILGAAGGGCGFAYPPSVSLLVSWCALAGFEPSDVHSGGRCANAQFTCGHCQIGCKKGGGSEEGKRRIMMRRKKECHSSPISVHQELGGPIARSAAATEPPPFSVLARMV